MSESPPRKRKRVSQACERCRTKKYKCDGSQPICDQCLAANAECNYVESAKRRGLQQGYVKALETLWSLLFKHVDGSEQAAGALLGSLAEAVKGESNDRDRYADPVLQEWKNSGIPATIESLLAGREWTNTTPSLKPAQQVKLRIAAGGSRELGALPADATSPVAQDDAEPSSAYRQPTLPGRGRTGTYRWSCPRLPEDWYRLIQVYLGTEYTWLPIVEKNGLFRTATQYTQHLDNCVTACNLDVTTRADFAVIWAVLALGETRSRNGSSRTVEFLGYSHALLDGSMESYSSSHAICFLLWSLLDLGGGRYVQAKLLLAQALVLANGHNRPGFRDGQWKLQHILACACFVVDGLLAMVCDTRPLMRSMDLAADTPCDDCGADEWEPCVSYTASSSSSQPIPSRIPSTFNELTSLFRLINDLLLSRAPPTFDSDTAACMRTTSRSKSESNMSPAQAHLQIFEDLYAAVVKARCTGWKGGTLTNIDVSTRETVEKRLKNMVAQYGVESLPASCGIIIDALDRSQSADLTHLTAPAENDDKRRLRSQFRQFWRPRSGEQVSGHGSQQFLETHRTSPQWLPHKSVPAETVLSAEAPTTSSTTDFPGMDHSTYQPASILPASFDLDMYGTGITASDVMAADPLQDYLALIDGNQNTGSNDFLLSLGFFGDSSFDNPAI